MLEFWMINSNEPITFEDGAIENPPERKSDFSISIEAFHRTLDIGLRQVAKNESLSFFADALIDIEGCKNILAVLLEIDAKYNAARAKTETLAMANFFSMAIENRMAVVVICD